MFLWSFPHRGKYCEGDVANVDYSMILSFENKLMEIFSLWHMTKFYQNEFYFVGLCHRLTKLNGV